MVEVGTPAETATASMGARCLRMRTATSPGFVVAPLPFVVLSELLVKVGAPEGNNPPWKRTQRMLPSAWATTSPLAATQHPCLCEAAATAAAVAVAVAVAVAAEVAAEVEALCERKPVPESMGDEAMGDAMSDGRTMNVPPSGAMSIVGQQQCPECWACWGLDFPREILVG